MTTAELLHAIRRAEADPPMPFHRGACIGCVSDVARVTRRTVEEAIQVARIEGAPIISDGSGVRIATTAAEMFDQYRRLRSRFLTQATTARATLRTARRMQEAEDAAAEMTLGLVA